MALQRRVAAYLVVGGLEVGKCPFKITGIPEQHLVEKFSPRRAALLHESSRARTMPTDASTASVEAEPASSNTPADATILLSLPGIGAGVLATLLAEGSDALRRRDYHALRCLCGVAPVTRRSGKSLLVVRRLAAHDRLRDAAYHWARVAAQRDPASRAKYQALRSRGHGHARSLRAVADRLLNIACAMLRDGVCFNPHRAGTATA